MALLGAARRRRQAGPHPGRRLSRHAVRVPARRRRLPVLADLDPRSRDQRRRGARGARQGGGLEAVLPLHDRSQGDRRPVPGHRVPALLHRRHGGDVHALRAGAARRRDRQGPLQHHHEHTRGDDDHRRPDLDHRRARELPRADHGRDAGHGVPEGQRAELLAAADPAPLRRHQPAARRLRLRLDRVSAAEPAGEPGSAGLPDGVRHHRRVVDPERGELPRDGVPDARARVCR